MKNYRAFVEELLGEKYESPLKNTYGTAILGTAGFIETITTTHITSREADRDLPALRQFATGRPSLDAILTAVNTVVGNDEKLARQAGMYLCHKYSGEKLRTIGEVFNVRESAISEAGRTFPRKMEKDKELNGVIERIRGMLAI